jgi:hypothetical protein
MANKKTPLERAEIIISAQNKARKGYKLNTKKPRSASDDELVVIRDMLISLKLVGYTNKQCGAIVGLSKGQVGEITGDENFKRRLTSLRDKLPEAAVNLGRAYLVEAVQAVIHILRTETDSALVLKAAAEIFDRFGIPKVSKIEAPPDKPPEDEIPKETLDKLRLAPPEVQEQVAALQESFVEGVERILSGGVDENTD